uniref:C3/C5 convertase n=1 Tax=Gouania willdenowi TaxID=441366 RepID=A0A8C5NDI3_GOUWI
MCIYFGGQVQCECPGNTIGIEGGNYTLTNQMHQGSLLVYQCREGYFPFPHRSRQCLHSGKWNPEPDRNLPQRCNLVKCPSPIVLMNGDVYPPAYEYLLGNETTYECYSGYTLKGSSSRICQKNGKWDGRTPTCSEDSGSENICPDPGIPPGARRRGNMFGVDDRVTYSCSEDMILVGSKERTCMENGQWTGREPACYYKHTYDTPEEVAHAFGGAIRESLTTLQSTGEFALSILKNGTLNIYIAMDVSGSIEEKYIIDAKKAVKQLMKKISSFTVSPNYDIVFFTSVIHKAVNILHFFDGTVKRDKMADALDKVPIDKSIGGTDLTKVFTHFLEQMNHIKIAEGDEKFKNHSHVIIVFTDGGFNEGGVPTPTVARIKNLVYLSNIPGKHDKKREEHLDIYIFGIGAYIYQDDLTPLTVGTEGQHFFKLESLTELNKTFDQMIDESEVMGLCGLHRSYETTDNDAKSMNPWYAEVINGDVKRCFGSLVTTKFILTAAHCFRARDTPEHVKVIIDDEKNSVEKFTLHEKFEVGARKNQGVPEFYEYDVALIELKEDVVISNTVRPICIPCTTDTRDALRMNKQSTCKQQEELLLSEDIVQLSFLTKPSDNDHTLKKVLVKNVKAKLRNNREECIKYALKAPNVTTTDVSLIVTDNFLCTGGVDPTIDHIACTGDSGGAVFKDYDYRTIQVGVVSWGTKELCKSGGLVVSEATSRDFHINLFKVLPFLRRILGKDTNEYTPLKFLN